MRTRTRTTLSALLTATLTASVLSGCLAAGGESTEADGTGASSVEEAAKREGQVVWYTSLPQAVADEVTEAFTEKYGIHAESVVLSTSLITARLASEEESGQTIADVITAADPLFFEDSHAKGWFAELVESGIGALGTWPEDFLVDSAYVLVNVQPAGIAYNTEKISKEAVDTWEELLDPSLAGQMYMCDPEKVPSWLALVKMWEEELGPDYVRRLGAQNLEYVDSLVPGAQQLAAGSASVLIPGLLSVTNPLKEEGAPVDLVIPSPTIGVEQFAAVMTNAPHPNAGRLLLDFLMSEEGQQVLNRGTGASPLGPLPGTIELPADYRNPDIRGAQERHQHLLDLLGK